MLDNADMGFVMNMSEAGKRLCVVPDGKGALYICVNGPKTQAWAGSTNPSHNDTLARLLLGETHTGRRIRFKDHNPFNLCRDNIEIEVKTTQERFPVDWAKAEERRAELLDRAESKLACQKAVGGRTVHSGSTLTPLIARIPHRPLSGLL